MSHKKQGLGKMTMAEKQALREQRRKRSGGRRAYGARNNKHTRAGRRGVNQTS